MGVGGGEVKVNFNYASLFAFLILLLFLSKQIGIVPRQDLYQHLMVILKETVTILIFLERGHPCFPPSSSQPPFEVDKTEAGN